MKNLPIFICLVFYYIGCSAPVSNNQDSYQVTIDSSVNAQINERRVRLAARNDSILNKLSTEKADSMIKVK